jgi:hypothetical protein
VNLLTFPTVPLLPEPVSRHTGTESLRRQPAPSQPWLEESDVNAFLQGRNYQL